MRSLIAARPLDGPGRLFVLIGRGTFSAAQFAVHELEKYTDAVFVGEPTSGKPNSYGDSRKTLLPRSGVTVRASIFWWQEHPLDARPWKAPDVAAELTSADYRANVDPAMQAALKYRPGPPLADRMRSAFAAGDSTGALRLHREYKRDPRYAYADTEERINALGYELLGQERVGPATALFELNAAAYPRSANAHDSLGEIYMVAGRREEAIRSYRKSLELNPGNLGALGKLKELGAT
ncbi:MAG: tetratricopeptide repeat protein [Gemmatimonadales bacterium]|nr:tetratricopeptide repeat protein [Gemmatimonadales bacterium]